MKQYRDTGFYALIIRFRRLKTQLREWILEDQAHKGLGGPPNNWQHYTFKSDKIGASTGVDDVFVGFGNDAHDIQIAEKFEGNTQEQWVHTMSATDFRRIALWYLWRWAWGEWFGLRRWLYYKWLHRYVENRRKK